MKQLSLILVTAFVIIGGCSQTPHIKPEIPSSGYYMFNNSDDWQIIEQIFETSTMALVAKNENSFGILNEKYSRHVKYLNDIKYLGFMFKYSTFSSNMTIPSSQFLDSKDDNYLASRVSNIKKEITNLEGDYEGVILVFDSLQKLTDYEAEVLSNCKVDCLIFNSLNYLSVKQARILASFEGTNLCFPGLLWLGNGQAEALAGFGGLYLRFSKIKILNEIQAKAISRFNGKQIFFDNLDPESEELMSKYSDVSSVQLIFD